VIIVVQTSFVALHHDYRVCFMADYFSTGNSGTNQHILQKRFLLSEKPSKTILKVYLRFSSYYQRQGRSHGGIQGQ